MDSGVRTSCETPLIQFARALSFARMTSEAAFTSFAMSARSPRASTEAGTPFASLPMPSERGSMPFTTDRREMT